MAYIWYMAAQFRDEGSAVRFRDLFNVNDFDLASGKRVHLKRGVEKNDEWECVVIPMTGSGSFLNGHGGPANEPEARELDEAGRVLYKRLRLAPPFRRAMVGTEVGDWLSHQEFLGRAADLVERPDAYHGLVLSQELWDEVGRPGAFEPFGDGAVWIPWRGPRED